MNKATGEQENRGRREQSSLCTDTPSSQKKIGKRDVCVSPSLIVFRCIFAYFSVVFPLEVEKVLTEQHDCGLFLCITEYVMLWKISTRTCSIFCGFDMGSTGYISTQRFHVTNRNPCYPLLPLLPLLTLCYPCYPCYPLLPLLSPVTPCYPLLPLVIPCYP